MRPAFFYKQYMLVLTISLTTLGCAPTNKCEQCTNYRDVPGAGKADSPDVSQVISGVLGSNPGSFSDDSLYFGPDGELEGTSGTEPFARSYLPLTDGELRFQHGSLPPKSASLTEEEYQALSKRTPGQALDIAAKLFHSKAKDFDFVTRTQQFYDPTAGYWEGKCHSWCYMSVNPWVNEHVEVKGPAGQRGLWIGGEWISRADLGNWALGLADRAAKREEETLDKTNLTAEEILKGTWQYMMLGEGGGVIADIYLDRKQGNHEVWNQPFKSASMQTKTLPEQQQQEILDLAKSNGIAGGVTVKYVSVIATYCTEPGASHEDIAPTHRRTWNIYVITDEAAKMIGAFMADDARLKGIAHYNTLPARFTEDEPERFWKPSHQAVEDALNDQFNLTLDFIDKGNGQRLRFLLNTVLRYGVPATTRQEFETETMILAGPISEAAASILAQKYPGIANAYSPEQWTRSWGSRGLDAVAFGETWNTEKYDPEAHW
jgi:hypothetical protein